MVIDEVDQLVLDWRRERPDLVFEDLHILSRISRLSRRLELARKDAWRSLGLEAWEFDVLAALRRSGPPYELSPGELLKATLVTSGTMTNRIDRMERRALVRRLPDREDGRVIRVRLTGTGMDLADRALEALLGARARPPRQPRRQCRAGHPHPPPSEAPDPAGLSRTPVGTVVNRTLEEPNPAYFRGAGSGRVRLAAFQVEGGPPSHRTAARTGH